MLKAPFSNGIMQFDDTDIALIGAELIEIRDGFESDIYNDEVNTHWLAERWLEQNPDKPMNGDSIEYVLSVIDSYNLEDYGGE